MESDIKKTVILDFFGVPGSGKTTKSHEIANSYRRNGKTVIEPSYYLDHGVPPIIRKIKKYSMLFSIPSEKRRRIKEIVAANGYDGSNGKLNQIVNIASKLHAIRKYQYNTDYIIFDEGLAQAAISLSVNSGISADDNLRQIVSLIDNAPEIQLIDLRLSIVEALRRIELRNTGDTRVEVMSTEKEKETLMKHYEDAVCQIREMQPINGVNIGIPGGGY